MPHLSEEDRANLVAYLDNELDEAAAQALESKLSLDPKARAEADALRRTWELLDYLPKPEPSTDFTNKTLSKLSVLKPRTSTMLPVAGGVKRRRRWLLPLAWVAAVLLAVGGGFGLARLFTPPPAVVPVEQTDLDDHMARHLRVIENKQRYDLVEDLEFLRSLNQPDLFGDDTEL